jgi:UDP-N-acetylmuramyl tripeptide synthase
MELLDARRLTGPNLFGPGPGAILDVRCTPDEARTLIDCWNKHIGRLLDALGWIRAAALHRQFIGGVSLVLPARIDALYAASAVTEWALALCFSELTGSAAPDFDATLAEIRQAIEAEANPALLSLEDAATSHETAFLWDDDEVSMGHGRYSRSWPMSALPSPKALTWTRFRQIPVALITGTNGKTTTVRLAAHILRGTGKAVGTSSTESIAVNDLIIEKGDWSGPGGARAVLRHSDVEIAILETARGGLLRRGLAVTDADVALITNIAEDHFGDFASQSLGELLDIKWIVSQAVVKRGTLVLNADDALLVARSKTHAGRIDWFSMDADNPLLGSHTAKGGRAFVLSGDELLLTDKGQREVICSVGEIPITLQGAAHHNIANALAAAAVTLRLGASVEQVRSGLKTMSPQKNPGRSNLYDVQGFRVLVDFAHNPHAMRALFGVARSLPAKRRILCFGQAGDRTDEQIRELARSAWSIGLERIVISELAAYARGRAPGEVHAILRDELQRSGARSDQILYFEEESESFDTALQWARPGDLVILLALGGNAQVQAKLDALAGG